MDKKDIYEHLAKIYLGTPQTKTRKSKARARDFNNFFIIGIAIVVGFLLLLLGLRVKHKPPTMELSAVLSTDPIRLNYRFDPAKKEAFTVNLKKANLSKFNTLGFSIKKTNYDDIVSVRIEFDNTFKERSEVYIKDVPNKWKTYQFKFADFKGITDWNEMENLSFVIEEWNTRDNKGSVYIDNVRLSK